MPSILADATDGGHLRKPLSAERRTCYELATCIVRVRTIARPRGSLVYLASVDS
ncbi:hypothetical protein QFZ62_000527 [Clavibacter sp. B3I6]|uniref:hypothetical protein n=1 Tax=Clavibacter sp. B3I6 TaxID=3042268 RepID=UPI00277EF443|nr:hypothetical protein [Clavibacter sp. B3I6]MDQ0743219.1 hypothetical protein [Clavibacter sp. B3I6]